MKKVKKMGSHDDYMLSRVPLTERTNLLTISIIRIGATTALTQFMLGATLGHSMTFSQAMLATFLGSFILEFISLGLGIAGGREGLSTSLLSRWCGFGYLGSALVGVVMSVSYLGWFGVQNAIVAASIAHAMDVGKNTYHYYIAAALSGITISVLVAFGIRGLSWISKVAVPLFFLVIGYIFVGILQQHNIDNLFSVVPSGSPLSLGAAATVVAGGYIAGAIATPDLSRFCKNGAQVFWMITSVVVN